MKPALLIVAFGSLAAFGQQSTVIGTVNRFAASEITLKTPRGLFTIHADDKTEILKDNTHRGLSSLKVGDEISVRCEPGRSGKLVAVKIWADVVAFGATVRYANGDDIEVVTHPSSASPREEHRIVHLHPDTAFSTNRKDVMVGQDVQVVGLDVGNGAIDAARIALYNTDLPVR